MGTHICENTEVIDMKIKEYDLFKNTEIGRYLQGKSVFLTGGTGFLGQLYVEKLLRFEYFK